MEKIKAEKLINPDNPDLPRRLEYVLEHFRAKPDGTLYWKKRFGGLELKGHINNGYLRVVLYIDGKKLYISKHRVLFACYHKRWPHPECDHIDQNPLNNNKDNLRDATPSENMKNSVRRKKRAKSKSKYLGVFWCQRDQSWTAKTVVNGINKHIYYGKDELEAARKYNEYIIRHNIPNRALNEIPD